MANFLRVKIKETTKILVYSVYITSDESVVYKILHVRIRLSQHVEFRNSKTTLVILTFQKRGKLKYPFLVLHN